VSTIKSSAENLTLNADGANNDIKFQSNGSEVASIDQAGKLTAGSVTVTGDIYLSDNQAFRSGGEAILARYDPIIEIGSGDAQDYLKFKAGGAERMRISTAGVVSVPVGIELGSGVDGTAANTLDDYEEGTWTPTITCSTSGSYTMDTGANLLAYTKVGRVVHIQGSAAVDGESSPNGSIRMSLPFTPFTGTKDTDYCMGNAILANHGGTLVNNVSLFISGGTTWASFYNVADSGNTGYVDHGDVDTAWGIMFSMTYIAA
jgi:hypothetical protein